MKGEGGGGQEVVVTEFNILKSSYKCSHIYCVYQQQ